MPALRNLKLVASILLLIFCLEWLILTQSSVLQLLKPESAMTSSTSVLSDASLDEEFVPSGQLPVPYSRLEEPAVTDNQAGQLLTESDRYSIQHILAILTSTPTPSFPQIPKFILHDTAGEFSHLKLQELQAQAKGPLGAGIVAYIPRQGKPAIARPNFFDPNRPTTSAYEKGLDVLAEATRNREARRAWQAASETDRTAALTQAVAGLQVDGVLLSQRAQVWLNASDEAAFERLKAKTPLDGAKTTALWAVTDLCDRVVEAEETVTSLAGSPPKATILQTACQTVHPALQTSRARVASATNIELIQRRGSECFVTDTQVRSYNQQVPPALQISANRVISLQDATRPVYTESQYEELARLYLQAAWQAGVFPEITTHFLLDRGIGDHCDPRGLDLTYLYEKINTLLGHSWGTRYGIQPQYGLNLAQGDNVWWSARVLGSPSPK